VSELARRVPAWAITTAASIAYLIAAPASPDLAAASYRSSLFSSAGFTLWDNSWYGGHHLPAYSLLSPGLGALIGPQPLAAISMILATVLFTQVINGCFTPRAVRIATVWFAIGASVSLLSSRVPFDLGLAIGLGAVLVARRGHMWSTLALSVLTAIASPVAGAFLGLAFLTWALASASVSAGDRSSGASAGRGPGVGVGVGVGVGGTRIWAAALTLAALAPIALLAVAFPEGGAQPFVGSAFFPALAGVLVIGALIERPPADAPVSTTDALRLLRVGAGLYALALTGSYLVHTAVGGNADRLGALIGGPVAACVLTGASRRRRQALIVLAPFLLYWQANAPVADFSAAASDPAVASSYYTPLIGELHALGVGYGARPARIEVVATADHWEARWLAPHVMLARGWERQLDTYRNGLFYDGAPLSAARYRAWLSENAVSYVALSDAPLDYSASSEARLVRGGRVGGQAPYLKEIWHSRHWRLYAVQNATPLAQPPARLSGASSDTLKLDVPRPGSYTVRVHFTPYWALSAGSGSGSGCVSRGPGDWTEVQARRPGTFALVISFSLARVLAHGARCN
jgi:hypothetical protein